MKFGTVFQFLKTVTDVDQENNSDHFSREHFSSKNGALRIRVSNNVLLPSGEHKRGTSV